MTAADVFASPKECIHPWYVAGTSFLTGRLFFLLKIILWEYRARGVLHTFGTGTVIIPCLVFATGALRRVCWAKAKTGDFPQAMLLVRK